MSLGCVATAMGFCPGINARCLSQYRKIRGAIAMVSDAGKIRKMLERIEKTSEKGLVLDD